MRENVATREQTAQQKSVCNSTQTMRNWRRVSERQRARNELVVLKVSDCAHFIF